MSGAGLDDPHFRFIAAYAGHGAVMPALVAVNGPLEGVGRPVGVTIQHIAHDHDLQGGIAIGTGRLTDLGLEGYIRP